MAFKGTGATWWLVRAWFVVVVTLFAGIALATPLPYDDTKGKYSFQITVNDDQEVVFELKGAREVNTANVFAMEKPERIIVDLPTGSSLNWFRNVSVQKGGVQRVRVGSHDSKVRFVLDLSQPSKGAYKVFNADNMLRITIKNVGKKGPILFKEEPAPTSSPTITTPKPTSTVLITPTVVIVATNLPTSIATKNATNTGVPTVEESFTTMPSATMTPTPTPTLTPTATVEATENISSKQDSLDVPSRAKKIPTLASIEISPTPAEGESESARKVKLLSLGYEMSDKGEPCLRLKFSRVVSYQMVRSSQDLFVVTLDDVVLSDSSLSLAHFPPAAFSRFVSARAQVEKGGLKIFIYIENGSYLLSIPKGSEIWLKAYGGDRQ